MSIFSSLVESFFPQRRGPASLRLCTLRTASSGMHVAPALRALATTVSKDLGGWEEERNGV